MKTSTLVDTNIFIDVWGIPGPMTRWSRAALVQCRTEGSLIINPVIWSEIAPLIEDEGRLNGYSHDLGIEKETMPWSGSFQAGMTHARYRKAGGARERTLPDFLIGAHAAYAGHRLLTRDSARYRSYFPDLDIIAPDTHA